MSSNFTMSSNSTPIGNPVVTISPTSSSTTVINNSTGSSACVTVTNISSKVLPLPNKKDNPILQPPQKTTIVASSDITASIKRPVVIENESGTAKRRKRRNVTRMKNLAAQPSPNASAPVSAPLVPIPYAVANSLGPTVQPQSPLVGMMQPQNSSAGLLQTTALPHSSAPLILPPRRASSKIISTQMVYTPMENPTVSIISSGQIVNHSSSVGLTDGYGAGWNSTVDPPRDSSSVTRDSTSSSSLQCDATNVVLTNARNETSSPNVNPSSSCASVQQNRILEMANNGSPENQETQQETQPLPLEEQHLKVENELTKNQPGIHPTQKTDGEKAVSNSEVQKEESKPLKPPRTPKSETIKQQLKKDDVRKHESEKDKCEEKVNQETGIEGKKKGPDVPPSQSESKHKKVLSSLADSSNPPDSEGVSTKVAATKVAKLESNEAETIGDEVKPDNSNNFKDRKVAKDSDEGNDNDSKSEQGKSDSFSESDNENSEESENSENSEDYLRSHPHPEVYIDMDRRSWRRQHRSRRKSVSLRRRRDTSSSRQIVERRDSNPDRRSEDSELETSSNDNPRMVEGYDLSMTGHNNNLSMTGNNSADRLVKLHISGIPYMLEEEELIEELRKSNVHPVDLEIAKNKWGGSHGFGFIWLHDKDVIKVMANPHYLVNNNQYNGSKAYSKNATQYVVPHKKRYVRISYIMSSEARDMRRAAIRRKKNADTIAGNRQKNDVRIQENYAQSIERVLTKRDSPKNKNPWYEKYRDGSRRYKHRRGRDRGSSDNDRNRDRNRDREHRGTDQGRAVDRDRNRDRSRNRNLDSRDDSNSVGISERNSHKSRRRTDGVGRSRKRPSSGHRSRRLSISKRDSSRNRLYGGSNRRSRSRRRHRSHRRNRHRRRRSRPISSRNAVSVDSDGSDEEMQSQDDPDDESQQEGSDNDKSGSEQSQQDSSNQPQAPEQGEDSVIEENRGGFAGTSSVIIEDSVENGASSVIRENSIIEESRVAKPESSDSKRTPAGKSDSSRQRENNIQQNAKYNEARNDEKNCQQNEGKNREQNDEQSDARKDDADFNDVSSPASINSSACERSVSAPRKEVSLKKKVADDGNDGNVSTQEAAGTRVERAKNGESGLSPKAENGESGPLSTRKIESNTKESRITGTDSHAEARKDKNKKTIAEETRNDDKTDEKDRDDKSKETSKETVTEVQKTDDSNKEKLRITDAREGLDECILGRDDDDESSDESYNMTVPGSYGIDEEIQLPNYFKPPIQPTKNQTNHPTSNQNPVIQPTSNQKPTVQPTSHQKPTVQPTPSKPSASSGQQSISTDQKRVAKEQPASTEKASSSNPKDISKSLSTSSNQQPISEELQTGKGQPKSSPQQATSSQQKPISKEPQTAKDERSSSDRKPSSYPNIEQPTLLTSPPSTSTNLPSTSSGRKKSVAVEQEKTEGQKTDIRRVEETKGEDQEIPEEDRIFGRDAEVRNGTSDALPASGKDAEKTKSKDVFSDCDKLDSGAKKPLENATAKPLEPLTRENTAIASATECDHVASNGGKNRISSNVGNDDILKDVTSPNEIVTSSGSVVIRNDSAENASAITPSSGFLATKKPGSNGLATKKQPENAVVTSSDRVGGTKRPENDVIISSGSSVVICGSVDSVGAFAKDPEAGKKPVDEPVQANVEQNAERQKDTINKAGESNAEIEQQPSNSNDRNNDPRFLSVLGMVQNSGVNAQEILTRQLLGEIKQEDLWPIIIQGIKK